MPRSSIGIPSPAAERMARRNEMVNPVPAGHGRQLVVGAVNASRSWFEVQTLAPPAPVAWPTVTSGPIEWSTQPAANRSPEE